MLTSLKPSAAEVSQCIADKWTVPNLQSALHPKRRNAPMAGSGSFAAELDVFEQHRKEWSQSHPGKFVAIQDDAIAGFFGSYAEALKAGLSKFDVRRDFLVKQVWITEQVYLVS
jgi:hypothetical protein